MHVYLRDVMLCFPFVPRKVNCVRKGVLFRDNLLLTKPQLLYSMLIAWYTLPHRAGCTPAYTVLNLYTIRVGY